MGLLGEYKNLKDQTYENTNSVNSNESLELSSRMNR